MKKLLVTAAAAIALGVTALSPHNASAATARGGPTGYKAIGQIRLLESPRFCLTSVHNPKDGDPVFVAPCVRGDAWQEWLSVRVLGFGQIALEGRALNLGQSGGTPNARTVNVNANPSRYHYTISYTPVAHGAFVLNLESYKRHAYLFTTLHPKNVHPAYWGVSDPAKSQEQWLFPEWHKLNP